ncbi:MAG: hypothetical protein ACLQED_02675 [Desulfobaccales bacterium]
MWKSSIDKTLDKTQFQNLLNTLAGSLEKKYGIEGLVGGKIIDVLVDKLVFPERKHTEQVLSKDAETGLIDYVDGPLKIQIDEECETRHLYLPQEITFVFGHTHKPFEEPKTFPNLGNGVPVYNTGGWVVETEDPDSLHGGAAVLLNDNLDVASLRLYNEADDLAKYQVKVSEVPQPGQSHSDFFNKLSELVKPDLSPWGGFSDTVAKEVVVRRQILLDKIASQE